MQEALSVETRSGIRSLDTTELDSVSGGNPIIGGLLLVGFLAGFDLGVSGAAEELGAAVPWQQAAEQAVKGKSRPQ